MLPRSGASNEPRAAQFNNFSDGPGPWDRDDAHLLNWLHDIWNEARYPGDKDTVIGKDAVESYFAQAKELYEKVQFSASPRAEVDDPGNGHDPQGS